MKETCKRPLGWTTHVFGSVGCHEMETETETENGDADGDGDGDGRWEWRWRWRWRYGDGKLWWSDREGYSEGSHGTGRTGPAGRGQQCLRRGLPTLPHLTVRYLPLVIWSGEGCTRTCPVHSAGPTCIGLPPIGLTLFEMGRPGVDPPIGPLLIDLRRRTGLQRKAPYLRQDYGLSYEL